MSIVRLVQGIPGEWEKFMNFFWCQVSCQNIFKDTTNVFSVYNQITDLRQKNWSGNHPFSSQRLYTLEWSDNEDQCGEKSHSDDGEEHKDYI